MRWITGLLSPFWLTVYLSSVVFFFVAHLTNAKPLAEDMRILQISLNIAVVFAYAQPAINAAFELRPSGAQQLTLGITVAWIATIGQSLWVLLWRLGGQPSWMMNSDVINFLTLGQCIGAMLHISAPEAMPDGVPKRFAVRFGLTVGLAVLLTLAFASFRPPITTILEKIRPWVEEPDTGYDKAEGRQRSSRLP